MSACRAERFCASIGTVTRLTVVEALLLPGVGLTTAPLLRD
jgi:hypothetical protein